MIAASVIAIAAWGYTRYERNHITLDGTGEWWCLGEVCVPVCGDPSCAPRSRAACVDYRMIVKDTEERDCFTSITRCESERGRLLADRDVGGISGCRVISASVEDREAYLRHVTLAWILTGIVGLVALLWLVAAGGARAGRKHFDA